MKLIKIGESYYSINNPFNKNSSRVKLRKVSFPKPWFLHPYYEKPIYTVEKIDSTIIQELAEYLTYKEDNEWSKARRLAHFLSQNIDYDYTFSKYNIDANEIFSIYKTMLCGGYSKLFKTLCEIVNIKCEYSTGYTKTDFKDYYNLFPNHAWNYVRLDSVWYGFDVTWESTDSKNWLKIDLKEFSKTHYSELSEHQKFNQIDFKEFSSKSSIINHSNSLDTSVTYIKEKIIFCKDYFEFKAIYNDKIRSTSLWPEHLVFSKMSMDLPYYQRILRKTISSISSNHKLNKDYTQVKIKLEPGINPISIYLSSEKYLSYIIFNGDKEEYLRHIISKCERRDILSYARAIIASIQLDDELQYNNLIQESDTKISFDEIKSHKSYTEIINSDLTLYECSRTLPEEKYNVIFSLNHESLEFYKNGNQYFFINIH